MIAQIKSLAWNPNHPDSGQTQMQPLHHDKTLVRKGTPVNSEKETVKHGFQNANLE